MRIIYLILFIFSFATLKGQIKIDTTKSDKYTFISIKNIEHDIYTFVSDSSWDLLQGDLKLKLSDYGIPNDVKLTPVSSGNNFTKSSEIKDGYLHLKLIVPSTTYSCFASLQKGNTFYTIPIRVIPTTGNIPSLENVLKFNSFDDTLKLSHVSNFLLKKIYSNDFNTYKIRFSYKLPNGKYPNKFYYSNWYSTKDVIKHPARFEHAAIDFKEAGFTYQNNVGIIEYYIEIEGITKVPKKYSFVKNVGKVFPKESLLWETELTYDTRILVHLNQAKKEIYTKNIPQNKDVIIEICTSDMELIRSVIPTDKPIDISDLGAGNYLFKVIVDDIEKVFSVNTMGIRF